jgi:tRNA A37 N6-isopentenylltransferase MiaA
MPNTRQIRKDIKERINEALEEGLRDEISRAYRAGYSDAAVWRVEDLNELERHTELYLAERGL